MKIIANEEDRKELYAKCIASICSDCALRTFCDGNPLEMVVASKEFESFFIKKGDKYEDDSK